MVHSFKGISGNIGATNVFDLCVEIEKALKSKQIEKAYPLVKRLSEDMRQLIVSIKNYLEKVETQDNAENAQMPGKQKMDRDALQSLYQELAVCLENNDMNAIELINQIKENVDDKEFKKVMEIEYFIHDFDFLSASELLKRIS